VTATTSSTALALDASLALEFAGEHRDLLQTLAALDAAFAEIPRLDHAVAHTKLQWWREEIARWLAGAARHPLTIALPKGAYSPRRQAHFEACFRARFQAVDLELIGFAPATREEALTLIDRREGSLATLSVSLMTGLEDPPVTAFGRQLGRARGLRTCLLGAFDSLEERRRQLDDLREALAALLALRSPWRHRVIPHLIEATLLQSRLPQDATQPFPTPRAALAQCWRAWRCARRGRPTDATAASSTDSPVSE